MELDISNLALIEQLYELYQKDPSKIDPSWRHYFQQLTLQKKSQVAPVQSVQEAVSSVEGIGIRAEQLINAYRTDGHLLAKINPLEMQEEPEIPVQLQLETYGFSSTDLKTEFPTQGVLNKPTARLEEILTTLKSIYCNHIGFEYQDLTDPEMKAWIQEQIEQKLFPLDLSVEQKHRLIDQLNRSELFEAFLHTKYPGQKRFSLEGGETLIPMLHTIIETCSKFEGQDYFIGMSHRGRLNVMSNILKKSYFHIFSEFDEKYIPDSAEGAGDVKYHKGFTSDSLVSQGRPINVYLTANPSHLESVFPVVEGQTKAKQLIQDGKKAQNQIVPILIHGDASLAGQGIVYEALQLNKLTGYSTGGTIHLVINNQIGFTTLPKDARSTRYCTDIAKAFGFPIFHVNAEDPEGCFKVALLAAELRQKFHCDVFIDMNCFRKYGHNESDEPAFTQPLEYAIIRKKKTIREIYRDDLIQQGVLEKETAEKQEQQFKNDLQQALAETKEKIEKGLTDKKKEESPPGNPIDISFQRVDTAVSMQVLQDISKTILAIPEGFTIHPKLGHMVQERQNMFKGKPIDWGMGETLAYATLLWEGKHVRLTGQDSCRGTFSHRHGVWVDQVKEQNYVPLQHLKVDQGRFDLINSPLSENAALGFEYGYSLSYPKALVIWEAQFGDFANGAQVIIDQFISSAEMKWGQQSALTLFLPHGYEGQGPEHSSGRIERYLSLAGDNNMFITNLTNPAQLFHLLRRQAMRTSQRPLVIFTPKGLLRHPECVSPLTDLTQGTFQEVLDDPDNPKKPERIIFCTGRIYYDLKAARAKTKTEDIAIIRIEQLYPLHCGMIQRLLQNYSSASQYFWVQEEPQNMGAWSYISPLLTEILPPQSKFHYVGRDRRSSPAVGSYALHKNEQAAIMDFLFSKKPSIFELASDSKKSEKL